MGYQYLEMDLVVQSEYPCRIEAIKNSTILEVATGHDTNLIRLYNDYN